MSEIETLLKAVTDAIGYVFNLAPGPATMFGVILIGYILRSIKTIPNTVIPTACHVLGAVLYTFLNDRPTDMTASRFYVRSILTGLALGYAAWRFHEQVLSLVEDKIPLLGSLLRRADANGSTPPPTTPPPPDVPKSTP